MKRTQPDIALDTESLRCHIAGWKPRDAARVSGVAVACKRVPRDLRGGLEVRNMGYLRRGLYG